MMSRKLFVDLMIALLIILVLKSVWSMFTAPKPVINSGEPITLYDINFIREERSRTVPTSVLKNYGDQKSQSSKDIKLSDYKGKIIIVHFWGIDCPPCRHELPHYDAFVKAHPEIVHIPLTMMPDDPQALMKVQAALQQFRAPNLPVYTDEKSKIARFFDVSALPSTVFINKKGRVVGHILGPVDWQAPDVVALILKTIEESEL